MKITYTDINRYLIPNIVVNTTNTKNINKYGLLKLDYLKEYKRGKYINLLMANKLNKYLSRVSKECDILFNSLMNNYIKNDIKLTEKNKEANQLEWVRIMNNYKSMANEIVMEELIYE